MVILSTSCEIARFQNLMTVASMPFSLFSFMIMHFLLMLLLDFLFQSRDFMLQPATSAATLNTFFLLLLTEISPGISSLFIFSIETLIVVTYFEGDSYLTNSCCVLMDSSMKETFLSQSLIFFEFFLYSFLKKDYFDSYFVAICGELDVFFGVSVDYLEPQDSWKVSLVNYCWIYDNSTVFKQVDVREFTLYILLAFFYSLLARRSTQGNYYVFILMACLLAGYYSYFLEGSFIIFLFLFFLLSISFKSTLIFSLFYRMIFFRNSISS